MEVPELGEALASLRRLLALVEADEVDCEPAQLERLRGAEVALAALVDAQV